jgi:hypothetical protein
MVVARPRRACAPSKVTRVASPTTNHAGGQPLRDRAQPRQDEPGGAAIAPFSSRLLPDNACGSEPLAALGQAPPYTVARNATPTATTVGGLALSGIAQPTASMSLERGDGFVHRVSSQTTLVALSHLPRRARAPYGWVGTPHPRPNHGRPAGPFRIARSAQKALRRGCRGTLFRRDIPVAPGRAAIRFFHRGSSRQPGSSWRSPP